MTKISNEMIFDKGARVIQIEENWPTIFYTQKNEFEILTPHTKLFWNGSKI